VRRTSRHLSLFLAHRGDLLNYATGITGDHARAEDVVQEAYLRFDGAADKRLSEPVGYLYRIVRNLALDNRRQQVREGRFFVPDDAATEHAAEDRPSPEAEAVSKAEIRALHDAMAELPERMRIALEMHRFGECKLKDIAEHLGISIGLAHKLVVDGLEHCRERLYRSLS
jgi:RNA polymerase sigma factor (sigma-70 family)